MQVAIYARTSPTHGLQEVEKQLKKLRTNCRKCEWEIVQEYVDWRSNDLDAFKRMMADAAERPFTVVLFWDLDHLPARNVGQIHSILRRLASLYVGWRSESDRYFCTNSRPDTSGQAILAVLDALEKYENRQRRVNALKGVNRARRESRRLGSEPKVTVEQFRKAEAWLKKQDGGQSHFAEKLSAKLGVSRPTVYRLMKRAH
jgi:DNA invertase Pin-like site-specific DNA recombinase